MDKLDCFSLIKSSTKVDHMCHPRFMKIIIIPRFMKIIIIPH